MSYNLNSGYGARAASSIPFAGCGKNFFVGDSSTANLNMLQQIFGYDPDGDLRFHSTIDSAINECTASAGDKIYVMPGHTEALSDAVSLNLDIAGISIIGLGSGNLRPTITIDTATDATIPVTAVDITISNLIFTANFADIVSVFTLAAAQNFTLDNCFFKSTASAMNFLYIVDTDATTGRANGLTIKNCKWIEPDIATLSMVKLDGDMTNITIHNNYVDIGVNNNKAALMAIATIKSVFSLQMTDNLVYWLNTDTATGAILLSTDQADNSGIVARNIVQHADTFAELLITASSGLGTFENYASGVAGASGYILPAVDS